MNLSEFDAWRLANEAYTAAGLTRKYSGDPYIVHPTEVARLLLEFGIQDSSPVISAAFLHDVLEDVTPKVPDYGAEWISRNFGAEVTRLVVAVTNHYTADAFPQLSRKERSVLENQRLSTISDLALAIKLADVVSNTQGLWTIDQAFAEVYFREKLHFLDLVKTRFAETELRVIIRLFRLANTIIRDRTDQ